MCKYRWLFIYNSTSSWATIDVKAAKPLYYKYEGLEAFTSIVAQVELEVHIKVQRYLHVSSNCACPLDFYIFRNETSCNNNISFLSRLIFAIEDWSKTKYRRFTNIGGAIHKSPTVYTCTLVHILICCRAYCDLFFIFQILDAAKLKDVCFWADRKRIFNSFFLFSSIGPAHYKEWPWI